MSTKREEKKKLYKNKIIKAANEVFAKNGYNKTTIEQISKQAEVGVGTTYLYFKSKSQLYRETIKEKLNIKDTDYVFENIDYSQSASLQISEISSELMSLIFSLNKEIIKEYIHSFFKGDVDESNLIYNIVVDVDNNLKVKYNEILCTYEEKNMLKDSFNVCICTDIIFNLILESFYKYISLDNEQEKQILKELEEKIVFVIKPYEK